MELEEMVQRMHDGRLYVCSDPRLNTIQAKLQEPMYEYNRTTPVQYERQQELLRQMFAEIGGNTYVQPPFFANWAGKHVHIGHDVYANFNLTLVDDTPYLYRRLCHAGPQCDHLYSRSPHPSGASPEAG